MRKTDLLLVLGLLVSAVMPVGADDSDMINGNSKVWVYRRNSGEANKIGAIFTQMDIDEAPPDDTSDNPTWVNGTLTISTKRNDAGTHYDGKFVYTLLPVEVKNGGLGNRKHEYCRWEGTKVVAQTAGAPKIKIYASLFKGTNKGHGQSHRRLIVRFRDATADAKDGKKDPAKDEGCDEEPDDDVLQEENPPSDPPPYDP